MRVVATGAFVALAVAGCSSEGGGATGAVDEVELGPISALMQEAYGDPDEAQMLAQQEQVEDLVAACMAEQGFDYTPMDMSSSSYSVPEDTGMPEWGSVEFAEQFGYGMTTGEELAAAQGYEAPLAEEALEDPNSERVMAMSEGEQNAYYEALYGEQAMSASEDEVVEYDWTTAGCSGAAQHAVYEVEVEGTDTQDLSMRINELYEQSLQDPRYRTAEQGWATCMSDEGHDFSAPDEAQQSVNDAYNALWETSTTTTGEPDADAVAQVRELELATAAADARCRESVGVDTILQSVQADLEEAFYAENKAEVDAWAAAMQEKNGA